MTPSKKAIEAGRKAHKDAFYTSDDLDYCIKSALEAAYSIDFAALQQYKKWAELQLDADREAIDKLQKERDEQRTLLRELAEALKLLCGDANRLCDRQLGGTYEEDCRRAIDQARAALARTEEVLK